MLESALSGTFAPITSTDTFSFVDSNPDTITRASGSFVTDGFKEGDLVTVTGSVSNNFTYTIATGGVAALTLTLVAGDTVVGEASVSCTLTTERERLKAGTTRKFFTYEVSYLDTTTVEYEYFYGLEVNTATITIPTSGEVYADFEMIGLTAGAGTTQVPTSPNYTAAAETAPMAGSVSGSSLKEAAAVQAGVENITITLNNNRAAKFQVGDQFASHVEEGDFDAEMTMGIYFIDSTMQAKYLAGTRTDIELRIVDQQDGHMFDLIFPNVVFTTGDKALSGQTVTQNLTAYAEFDATEATKMILDWIPATVGAP